MPAARPASNPRSAGGLENVVVGTTTIGEVDGERGLLIYRGHDAVELAEAGPFEAVWHLLDVGRLPGAAELERFGRRVRAAGTLSPAEARIVGDAASGSASTLAAVRSGLSVLAAERGLQPWLERDPVSLRADVLGLAASMPAVVTAAAGARRGTDPRPLEGSSHAERYLHGITGRTPGADAVRALDRYLSLTADHGMNASTFVARVVTSTGADAGAAIVAALGALSGPLHGGAPGPVLEMLDEIGTPENARDWIARRIAGGHRIMGFGHRVYRTDDPRAMSLRRVAIESGAGRTELALAVEQAALEVLAETKPRRVLRTNVE
ncbi:MAG TPA: citrate/2-methylcitrate synthase, partial [Actinomycetota bacterium]|nr:citrate/2-methylcitrate synthase [Actinomycetota bacterium]